jgi:N-acetylglutamate synthase-like GNAT family acetyltransferase
VRPADRERVLRWVRDRARDRSDVIDDEEFADDELEARFEQWVTTPTGLFAGAELEGELAGVFRLRPIAAGKVVVEGLAVDVAQRRRGIATAMLERAIAQSRAQGIRQLRMVGSSPALASLAANAGFRTVVRAASWHASRLEGDEPAPLGRPADVDRLLQAVKTDPEAHRYAGGLVGPGEAADLDRTTLAERADRGRVRVGPGQRALAVLADREDHIAVCFLAGRQAALGTLAEQLRFEADLHDLPDVRVWLPEHHPAQVGLEEAGFRSDGRRALALYHLDLVDD